MRNDLLIGTGILGYLVFLLYIYMNILSSKATFPAEVHFPDIKVKPVPNKIIPQQVHISYHSINSSTLVFTLKENANNCTITYLNYTKNISQPTNILRNSYIYKIILDSLPENIEISYEISCCKGENTFSKSSNFMSHPGLSENVSILVLGDWSTSNIGDIENDQHTLIPKQHVLSAILKEATPFTSIWHLGDIAYDLYSNYGSRGDEFLNDLEPLISKIPYMPVVGNHEISEIFKDFTNRFSVPLFYSLPIGKATIIAISSEFDYYLMKPESFPYDHAIFNYLKHQQMTWLNDTLSSIDRNEFPWVIVMGHKPLYCSPNRWSTMIMKNCGIQAKVMRETFEEIFVKFKVDLYLSGHVHLYERVFPVSFGKMHKNYEKEEKVFINPDAPIHIINGVAGNLENTKIVFNVTDHPKEWSALISESLGYGILKIVNSTHLHYKQFAFGNTQNDEITEDLYSLKRLEDYFWIIKNAL
ncbi:unnamed protein product [Blepharisma stoltei]|uniref:Purple acid phosphatase n=1 Tax=Blepharisma stoltei TaxID=1481888 RepID=A0AAU9I9M4_9CILI|nr:unnamed protein product [Blepharisma stoltei]